MNGVTITIRCSESDMVIYLLPLLVLFVLSLLSIAHSIHCSSVCVSSSVQTLLCVPEYRDINKISIVNCQFGSH